MPEEIPFRRICNLSPRIVSPEFGHALQVCCVNTLGMSPQHVSIDVSHWEIQKHVDRAHLPSDLDNVPIQLQTIWVKQAQPATILFPPNIGKNLLKQNAIAVALVNVHFLAVLHEISQ